MPSEQRQGAFGCRCRKCVVDGAEVRSIQLEIKRGGVGTYMRGVTRFGNGEHPLLPHHPRQADLRRGGVVAAVHGEKARELDVIASSGAIVTRWRER